MPDALRNHRISVVIPTYNNEQMVLRCLEALCNQTFPLPKMEVVVVVDGSTDGTMSGLKRFQGRAPFPFQVLYQTNQGPGPARNLGIQRTSHNLLLILNDDLLGDPQLVEQHVRWHILYPEDTYALLGFVEELPGDKYEFYARRLETSFHSIRGRTRLEWKHFWTTNISLKKSFLERTGEWFSGCFPYPVHEDVEMGYRLSRHGLKLFSGPEAKGLHEHRLNYDQFMKNLHQSGVCLAVFYKLHPELRGYLVGKGLVSNQMKGLHPARYYAASLILNNVTSGVMERFVRILSWCRQETLAHFFFCRLAGHYQRQGVQEGLERYFLDQVRRKGNG